MSPSDKKKGTETRQNGPQEIPKEGPWAQIKCKTTHLQRAMLAAVRQPYNNNADTCQNAACSIEARWRGFPQAIWIFPLIFQEFKGTGNMELILDRKLSDRRLYPALDIPKSGTRKEEKLYGQKWIQAIHKLRREMIDTNPIEALETLSSALKKYKTNEEFLKRYSEI